MQAKDESQTIATIVDDMFFAAKIRGAAENSGRAVTSLRSRDQLEACLSGSKPVLLIVDLNSSKLDPLEAIRLVKSGTQTRSIPVIAFASHVETQLIREAQEAGADQVLPRSAFSQMLSKIVAVGQ